MHRLELEVGEQHLIELEGFGSAGYAWTFQLEGDPNIVGIVKQTNAPPPSPPNPETFSSQESFLVIAQAPGSVLVKFVQRRSWEGSDVPSRSEKVYEIIVKEPLHDDLSR